MNNRCEVRLLYIYGLESHVDEWAVSVGGQMHVALSITVELIVEYGDSSNTDDY